MSTAIQGIETSRPTSERLLAASETLILRCGAADLRVRSICQEAEANAALVSYYFGGIQGLLAQLLSINANRVHAARAELLQQALQVQAPDARLDALIRAYVDPVWLVKAQWNDAPATAVVRECLNIIETRWRTQTVAEINASVEAVTIPMLELLPHLTHNELVTRLRLLSGATGMLQPRLDQLGLFPTDGSISRDRHEFLAGSLHRFAKGALQAP